MQIGNFRGFEVALHDPGIALVTFNQPDRLNGMTQGLKRDLVEVLTEAQMDDAVRVVVITGSGKAFSAGDDISGRPLGGGDGATALAPDIGRGHSDPIGTYSALRAISQRLNTTARDLDKLTIAAVNGFAIQTGLSLALSCDFRIASTDARLGSGTLRFGLMPDEGGQYLLVQLLGVAKAMDFLMRNRIVSAEEALDLTRSSRRSSSWTARWTSPAS
jgi:2-(1,2-epoxy-1,2-dihydrophenyl)acetyl-CoA isomerase